MIFPGSRRRRGCWALSHPLDAWNGQIPILRVLGITEALEDVLLGMGMGGRRIRVMCQIRYCSPSRKLMMKGYANIFLCVYMCMITKHVYIYTLYTAYTVYIYIGILVHHKFATPSLCGAVMCVFPPWGSATSVGIFDSCRRLAGRFRFSIKV